MPLAPPKACSCGGCSVCGGRCPNLTTGGKCSGCLTEYRRPHRKNDHVYASPRWKALRRQVLREQPFCNEPGCTALTAEIDHIVPIEQGGAQYDRRNLQGLCKPHHSRKTARETLHRD